MALAKLVNRFGELVNRLQNLVALAQHPLADNIKSFFGFISFSCTPTLPNETSESLSRSATISIDVKALSNRCSSARTSSRTVCTSFLHLR